MKKLGTKTAEEIMESLSIGSRYGLWHAIAEQPEQPEQPPFRDDIFSVEPTEEEVRIVAEIKASGMWPVKRDSMNGNTPEECDLLRKAAVAVLKDYKPSDTRKNPDRYLGIRHVALQKYIEADFWDAKRALEKEPKANRAKITYYGYIYIDLYEQHWLYANWDEVPNDLKNYMQKPKKSKFMPIGSSFYVFPEAKKK